MSWGVSWGNSNWRATANAASALAQWALHITTHSMQRKRKLQICRWFLLTRFVKVPCLPTMSIPQGRRFPPIPGGGGGLSPSAPPHPPQEMGTPNQPLTVAVGCPKIWDMQGTPVSGVLSSACARGALIKWLWVAASKAFSSNPQPQHVLPLLGNGVDLVGASCPPME